MDVDANEQLLVSQFNSLLTTDKDSLVTELHTFLNCEITQQECQFYLEMSNWNLQGAIGAFYDHSQPNRSSNADTQIQIPKENLVTQAEFDSMISVNRGDISRPPAHSFAELMPAQPDACSNAAAFLPSAADNRMMDFVDEEYQMTDEERRDNAAVDDALLNCPAHNCQNITAALSTTSDNHILARNTRFSIRVAVKNLSSQPFAPGTSLRLISGYYLHLNAEHLAVETLSSYGETSVYITGVVPGEVGTFNTVWRLSTALGTFFGQVLQLNIEVSDEVSSISDLMNNSHIINDDVNMDE